MRPVVGGRFILVATAAMLLVVTAVLAQAGNFWAPPPLSDAAKTPTTAAPPPLPQPRPAAAPASPLKIVVPGVDKSLRGVVDITTQGLDSDGYVVFRIDGEFAYATASPFKMRWDTAGAEDGDHLVEASGFSGDKQLVGRASAQLRVQNRILGALPSEGIALQARAREGQTIVRNVEATAEVAGLDGGNSLPANLRGLNGQLYARFSQSVVEVNPADNSANLRTSVRLGILSAGGNEAQIQEEGRYGMVSLMPSGLEMPPPPDSKRPRVGLGELSLALPAGRLHEGMTWTSPMRVIAELVQRRSIQVQGTHTFEGIWWMKGRKCARISSSYEIGDIVLAGAAAQEVSSALDSDFALELTAVPAAWMGRAGRGGGRPPTGTAGRNLPAASRTRTAGQPAAAAPARSRVAARLTGLTGNRASWIDIERGMAVRTEDHITGTLVIAGLQPTTTPAAPSTQPAAEEAITTSSLFTLPGAPERGGYLLWLTGREGRGGGGGGGGRGGGGGGGGGAKSKSTSTGGGRSSIALGTRPATKRTASRGSTGSAGPANLGGRRGGGGGRALQGSRTTRRGSYSTMPQRRMIPTRPPEEELSQAQRLPYTLTLIVEIAD